ncbi:MAG: AAA family ATPase, partial [Spirochaetaceae bacterium]|nr:AAA family ATPase [Spirochaetaceae bacterium]
MGPGQVSLRVLGRMRLFSGGSEVPLPARQVRRLMAALAVAGGARSRRQLVTDLWGEAPPRSADKVLQQYVSQLRRAAPALSLTTTDTGYALALAAEAHDARLFEDLVASGRQALRAQDPALAASVLRRADALWSGRAYEEFAHEGFATAEANRLEDLRREALEDRWEAELALGRHATLHAELTASATAEPLRERLQGLAMLAAYRAGEQGAALEVFRRAREALVEELGVDPGPGLRDLQRRVLEQDPSLALTTEPLGTTGLPAALNALRGRATELAELRALLRQDDVRLLVLTGAGGSGKSRLALEVAREAAGAFAHGSAFLELADVRDPARLPEELCRRLGVPRLSPDALEDLAQALRARELLLVLDNLEQLRAGGAVLVELLRRTSGLRLLVTSRVVLHLSGEHVYPVDPLAEHDAAALLVERAGASVAGLSDQEQVLRRLCLRLDRLPLAIELAATRLRSLTPAELLARLDERLPSLARGARDLPARQQTLQATLEWSHDLLEPVEREALARLAVFPSGCSLASAQAVCDVPLEVLSTLVDHHLLSRSVGGDGSRFGMLETVRAFAAERLALLEDREQLHRRHAERALEVALSLGLAADARGGEVRQRHADVAAEAADLHQALDWAAEHDPVLGLRIAIALEQHWITSDPRDGVRQFERLLTANVVLPPALHATALRDLAGSVEVSGDWPRAEGIYLRSLALFQELDDEAGTLSLRHRLANMHLRRGDLPAARAATEQALSAARAGRHTFL